MRLPNSKPPSLARVHKTSPTFGFVMRLCRRLNLLVALPLPPSQHLHHEADNQGPRLRHQKPLRPHADLINSHCHLPAMSVSRASAAKGNRRIRYRISGRGRVASAQTGMSSIAQGFRGPKRHSQRPPYRRRSGSNATLAGC